MLSRWLIAAALAFAAAYVQAAEVTVAVASNFIAPLKAAAAQFEAETGHQLRIVSGSSGKLHAQIVHGAPFDIFLSADREKPESLERAGHAVPGSRFTYALGTLALWSPRPDTVAGVASLDAATISRLAIANPRVAPYGRAAVQTLQALGLLAAFESRLVSGENIAQAYQFVATGNAPLGFVALSQIAPLDADGRPRRGSAWVVPAALHEPIAQDAVLLQRARNTSAAREFLAWLRSGTAREIIVGYGYRFVSSP